MYMYLLYVYTLLPYSCHWLWLCLFSGSKSGEVFGITCSSVAHSVREEPFLSWWHSILPCSRLWGGFCPCLSAQMWFKVLCIFCATQALTYLYSWTRCQLWWKTKWNGTATTGQQGKKPLAKILICCVFLTFVVLYLFMMMMMCFNSFLLLCHHCLNF